MFRSLMTIIRELFLYLTKVTFMLKHSVKLRRYRCWVMWQHALERHVCCVLCTALHTTHMHTLLTKFDEWWICWCVNYVDLKMHCATIKIDLHFAAFLLFCLPANIRFI
jgi:hypothetical protein